MSGFLYQMRMEQVQNRKDNWIFMLAALIEKYRERYKFWWIFTDRVEWHFNDIWLSLHPISAHSLNFPFFLFFLTVHIYRFHHRPLLTYFSIIFSVSPSAPVLIQTSWQPVDDAHIYILTTGQYARYGGVRII